MSQDTSDARIFRIDSRFPLNLEVKINFDSHVPLCYEGTKLYILRLEYTLILSSLFSFVNSSCPSSAEHILALYRDIFG